MFNVHKVTFRYTRILPNVTNNVVWRLRVDTQRGNNYIEYYKLYHHKITTVDKQSWSKQ